MPVDGFDDVRFPAEITFGATGGPEYSTTIVVNSGGHEQRNQNWSQSRGKWNVAHGLKSAADTITLIKFFRARKGRARSFRFKDWTDYKAEMGTPGSTGIVFATGDGATTTFQLTKVYSDAGGTYTRNITKPVVTSVSIWLNGTLQTAGQVTVSGDNGIATFAAAPGSVPISWSGEFDTHARFDTDTMELELEFHELHNWEVPVVEVRD